MASKLDRKTLPAGHTANDFTYTGRPATEQGEFGKDIGLADMACVNQMGEANNAKYYHAGVVKSSKTGAFYVYLEWGRMKAAKSWNGSFGGGDFQFVECSGEADARDFFAKQAASKNIKRMMQRSIGGKTVWTSKDGEDGYIVQRLATREKGLPDAYLIKDNTGIQKPAVATAKPEPTRAAAFTPKAPTKAHQPQVITLAQDLVGGVQTFTRAMSAASGITPTMGTIKEVREDLIPAALTRIKIIGADIALQVRDADLVAITKMVMALVPRPIPHKGISEEEAILSGNNILTLQQDLDAFEASLANEDFNVDSTPASSVNPDALLNANLRWIDLNSAEGKWLAATYNGMNDGRHSNVRNVRIRNLFAVCRPDRDALFLSTVKHIASRRKGQLLGDVPPRLQPASRSDISDISDCYKDANVFLGIHGTRSVNVSGILGSNFRLPKSLRGVHISGAAFGHGVYFAVQVGKSAQYVGFNGAAYGSGGGIRNRGNFMFLCDVAGGKFHYPRSAWGIDDRIPGDADSVFAHPRYCSTLQNDEHVIMNPNQQRIRYLVEVDFK